jgi:hypothetical protein
MPRKPSQEERAKKYMNLLNVNYDEALQMVKDDDTIDNGGKCDWEVELTPEQKKIVRKARMADREVKMEKTKRTRKENPDKQNLIEKFREVLENETDEIEVLNPEREIAFIYNGTRYKITLSSPRVPKE